MVPGSAAAGSIRFTFAQAGRVGEHRQDVLALEILVIGEDLLDALPGAEELEDEIDGIPQAPDTRLAVTHLRIYLFTPPRTERSRRERVWR
jgi:hypothetical protein